MRRLALWLGAALVALLLAMALLSLVWTPYDPTLEEEIQAGREFMHDFRDTFHQLAK